MNIPDSFIQKEKFLRFFGILSPFLPTIPILFIFISLQIKLFSHPDSIAFIPSNFSIITWSFVTVVATWIFVQPLIKQLHDRLVKQYFSTPLKLDAYQTQISGVSIWFRNIGVSNVVFVAVSLGYLALVVFALFDYADLTHSGLYVQNPILRINKMYSFAEIKDITPVMSSSRSGTANFKIYIDLTDGNNIGLETFTWANAVPQLKILLKEHPNIKIKPCNAFCMEKLQRNSYLNTLFLEIR